MGKISNELFIHDVGTMITTSSGVFFNLFLLLVIVTDSTVPTKGYKKMLAIISIYNIYFSIVHKVVEPIYLIDKWGFICISKNFANTGSYQANFIALAFFVNSFAQSLSFLGLHCLFRYSMITFNYRSLFNTWWGLTCVFIFHCVASMLYVCFCVFGMTPSAARNVLSAKDAQAYFNITLDSNSYYYGPVFKYPDESGEERFRWDQITGSTFCLIACGSFYTLICVTGIKLYYYVKKAAMTTTMRKIQLQLLYVLLAQAVSPLFCEFLPAMMIVYGGVLGLVGPPQGVYASVFISGYSPVDACLALILFKAYRVRALGIMAKVFPCLKKYSVRKSQIYLTETSARTTKETRFQTRVSARYQPITMRKVVSYTFTTSAQWPPPQWVFFFNLFLLYVIVTDSTVTSTGHKKMLAIISIYNIYFSIVHKVVEPIYLIDKWGFICISKNFAHTGSYQINFIALAFYVNSFAQSLSLLGVHCFFRYSMITGNFRSLFNTWWGLTCVFIFHCVASMLYVCFCVFGMTPSAARNVLSANDAKAYFNITLDKNSYYYGPVFKYPDESGEERFRWDQITGSTFCLISCGLFYTLVCVTGVKLYFHVKNATMTATMKRIQLQLLYVLLAQALSPLLCEFLPATMIVYGGVMGLVGPPQGVYASVFISGYSPVDACLALFLFKAYRTRVFEIFAKVFPCLKLELARTTPQMSKETPPPQAVVSPTSSSGSAETK